MVGAKLFHSLYGALIYLLCQPPQFIPNHQEPALTLIQIHTLSNLSETHLHIAIFKAPLVLTTNN